jgi:uncharacterized protein (DUF1778 family)
MPGTAAPRSCPHQPSGISDTVDTMRASDSKPGAMSLRFPDPGQHAAIATAAKAAGVSMQEYILSAAYERATAVEARFLEAFDASLARTREAFAESGWILDPGPDQRAAEAAARQGLDAGQGHAA